MKKSELRQLIREEIQKLNEEKISLQELNVNSEAILRRVVQGLKPYAIMIELGNSFAIASWDKINKFWKISPLKDVALNTFNVKTIKTAVKKLANSIGVGENEVKLTLDKPIRENIDEGLKDKINDMLIGKMMPKPAAHLFFAYVDKALDDKFKEGFWSELKKLIEKKG